MSLLPEIKKILYVTDLGKHTRPVFRFALSLARRYEAALLMLHVVEPLGPTGEFYMDIYLNEDAAKHFHEEGKREVLLKMKERLRLFCDEEVGACEMGTPPVTEILVSSGEPSEEILRLADKHGVDCIVIGKSTHSLLGGHMMGSTARRVSRHSRVPVMLVPNK
ncbi:MAG: universal stress protein [Desulfobulbus sp.]|nr:MAG: universal stress protein [Desulfobulbus sp.]